MKDILTAVRRALEGIEVHGRENLNGLLASIQALDRAIDSLEKEGGDDDPAQ